MIKQLLENMSLYFWSKSNEDTIIIGGHNNGRFYGQIELTLDEQTATIKTDVSNGVSSSIRLADRSYSNQTEEYQQIKELFDRIDEYLNNSDTKLNQELYREKLMHNVLDLLPNYSDVG